MKTILFFDRLKLFSALANLFCEYVTKEFNLLSDLTTNPLPSKFQTVEFKEKLKDLLVILKGHMSVL